MEFKSLRALRDIAGNNYDDIIYGISVNPSDFYHLVFYFKPNCPSGDCAFTNIQSYMDAIGFNTQPNQSCHGGFSAGYYGDIPKAMRKFDHSFVPINTANSFVKSTKGSSNSNGNVIYIENQELYDLVFDGSNDASVSSYNNSYLILTADLGIVEKIEEIRTKHDHSYKYYLYNYNICREISSRFNGSVSFNRTNPKNAKVHFNISVPLRGGVESPPKDVLELKENLYHIDKRISVEYYRDSVWVDLKYNRVLLMKISLGNKKAWEINNIIRMLYPGQVTTSITLPTALTTIPDYILPFLDNND